MNVKMELLKRGCEYKNEAIQKAIADAYEQIVTVVKECGGVLKTPASSDKITLYAFYESAGSRDLANAATEAVAIQGLRWDDELGLCICTNDMLDNYQFDNGYEFEYYFDFEGEDLENLNKALDDPAYFVEFDKYDLVYADTVMSIIGGIADYLE
jgi:hypothetical protein